MLPSSNRIKQKEFPTLFKSGRSIHQPLFTFVSGKKIPQIVGVGPKCAVVVSKSVAKGAVDRNKIKRRIYAILSKNKKVLEDDKFYIFLIKKPATQASFAELKGAVEMLILKKS